MASLNDQSNPSGSLIAGDQVSGTTVYNRGGAKLGTVDDVMIDKKTGRIAYAVMSFGGFLGIGDKYHPLPWSALQYDQQMGGYVVDLDRSTLEGAPSYAADEQVTWEDPAWGRRVHDYYGAEPYWTPVP